MRLLLFAMLGVVVAVSAAAQLPVDLYTDFEAGSDGDSITTNLLVSGSRGSVGTWSISSSGIEVSTNHEWTISGVVSVAGTNYDDSA